MYLTIIVWKSYGIVEENMGYTNVNSVRAARQILFPYKNLLLHVVNVGEGFIC
jgi:hypothetical protein